MRKRHWNTENLEKLINCHKSGSTGKQIENELKIPYLAICRQLKRMGIIPNKDAKQWTDQEKQDVIDYKNKRLTYKEIGRILNCSPAVAHLMGRKLGITVEKTINVEKANWIKENYNNYTNKIIAEKLSLTKSCVDKWAAYHGLEKNRITPEFEKTVLEDYKIIQNVHKICKKYRIHPQTFLKIRQKYNIPNLIPKRRHRLESYIEMYGEEIAKQKWDEMKRSNSERMKDDGNPMFGKPPPTKSSRGYCGRYKSYFFRSCLELCFIILMERNNIKWVNGESIKYRIPYITPEGKSRNYFPDFVLECKYIYEIKPDKIQTYPLILAKTEAAKQFCKNNNLEYIITDIYVDKELINSERQNIEFLGRKGKDFDKAQFRTKNVMSIEEQSKKLFPFLFK